MTESAQESLRTRLSRTAQQHSHAALEAYRQERFETFYVQAGIVLELAMKAKLARELPYLLAADGFGWFKHGHRIARDDTSLPGPKSVSTKDALERLKALDPDLVTGIATQITETIEHRDQSVHMGPYNRPTDDELLTHAAAFVEAVDGLSLQESAEFWGNWPIWRRRWLRRSATSCVSGCRRRRRTPVPGWRRSQRRSATCQRSRP